MPDKDRHFDTPPELWNKLKPLAREMRHEPTPAEDKLWQHLRNRRVQGQNSNANMPLIGLSPIFVVWRYS